MLTFMSKGSQQSRPVTNEIGPFTIPTEEEKTEFRASDPNKNNIEMAEIKIEGLEEKVQKGRSSIEDARMVEISAGLSDLDQGDTGKDKTRSSFPPSLQIEMMDSERPASIKKSVT